VNRREFVTRRGARLINVDFDPSFWGESDTPGRAGMTRMTLAM